MKEIRVCQPTLTAEIFEDLKESMLSGWLGYGAKVTEFEKEFAKKVGRKFAVACNSGTSALDMCIKVWAWKHGIDWNGTELITTPMTFLSDAIVGLWHGMDITFSDIEEDSLCMDMDSLHISPKTKAIIVVDCHGRLANIKKLREKWDGFILEDAAHAMWTPGVGEYSDLQMYSFQAVKTMPIGDGGMLTTDDEDMAKEARRLSWLNIEKSTYDRTLGRKYTWDYDVTRTNGIKAYMTNTQAVIGLGQLKRLDNMLKRRREIQATYNEAFKDIPQIKTPQYSHTVQYYTMQCEDRDELSDYLSKQTPQIQTSVHFKPLYEFQAYKQYKKYSTPVCDRVWKRLLSLPCHNALTDEEQDFVIKKVREFYGK